MIARIPFVLLVLTASAIAAAFLLDVRFPISADEAIRRELRPVATTEELDGRILAALEKGDAEDAAMYAEIADYLRRPLPEETRMRLAEAMTTSATLARNAVGFASGFVSGDGATTAEFAGSVASDLTVIGDVRDIASEGGKMVVGDDYSQLIFGLSVVGLAASGVSVATGGGGLPAKLGVSTLKVAARAGTLTAEFAAILLRLTRDAVNLQGLGLTLRGIRLTDLRATEDALLEYARGVRQADIFPVVAKLGDLGDVVGPGETVRLLRYVRTTDDLDDIAAMGTRLGKKTRGVVELTGKTSLRAFRMSLNVFEFLAQWIIALAAWIASILGLSVLQRIMRRRRRSA
nr:MAG: hypothetical protein E4H34_03935 [Hyphomicrobiales bacterium]